MFGNKIIGSTKSNPAARRRAMLPPEIAGHSSLKQDPVFLETDVESLHLVQRYKLIPARVVQPVPNNKHSDLGPHTERRNIYLHLGIFRPQDRKMARVSNPSLPNAACWKKTRRYAHWHFARAFSGGFLSGIPEAVLNTLDKDLTILMPRSESRGEPCHSLPKSQSLHLLQL